MYGVDVVSYDIDNDLALLKLKNQNVQFSNIPYTFAKNIAEQGAKAFVLGYPMASSMGEEIKLTDGLVSARSGYKGSISQYQFSAPIQPGNSGSPLFNEDGDVIGVINAKLKEAEAAGYAIKSPLVSTFLQLANMTDLSAGTNTIKQLSLPEKTALLKNNIFIVKAE